MSLFKRFRITKDNIVFTRIENRREETKMICKYCLHHAYSRKNNICSICVSQVNVEWWRYPRKITIGYVII